MQTGVSIGQAAEQTGIKVPTIRYYERIGLVPVPPRTEGTRRQYSQAEVQRLAFIRHARKLGFEIDGIRTMLSLQDRPDQSCAQADVIAKDHLREVERRIVSLQALRDELERMVDGCSHGRVESCRVIETLADHGKCVHPHH